MLIQNSLAGLGLKGCWVEKSYSLPIYHLDKLLILEHSFYMWLSNNTQSTTVLWDRDHFSVQCVHTTQINEAPVHGCKVKPDTIQIMATVRRRNWGKVFLVNCYSINIVLAQTVFFEDSLFAMDNIFDMPNAHWYDLFLINHTNDSVVLLFTELVSFTTLSPRAQLFCLHELSLSGNKTSPFITSVPP